MTKQWVSDQTRLFVIFEHIKLVINQKNTNEFILNWVFFLNSISLVYEVGLELKDFCEQYGTPKDFVYLKI
jgi:uncharacterized protein YktA (UPF0223 family)